MTESSCNYLQKPHPPIYSSALKDPRRAALRIASDNLSGRIGIQDSAEDGGPRESARCTNRS
jgi:hypothetical protein